VIARLPTLVILPILLVAFLLIIPECSYSTPQEMPNIQKRAQDFLQPELSLLVANNPIDRGNRQTVTAEVFDLQSKQGIPGVKIKGTVTYASLLPIYEFNGKTDGNGNFSYSWTIDRDAEPGTFIVVVAATSEQYTLRLVESTLFEVS
jgi:phosphatidate phosphatase APP1